MAEYRVFQLDSLDLPEYILANRNIRFKLARAVYDEQAHEGFFLVMQFRTLESFGSNFLRCEWVSIRLACKRPETVAEQRVEIIRAVGNKTFRAFWTGRALRTCIGLSRGRSFDLVVCCLRSSLFPSVISICSSTRIISEVRWKNTCRLIASGILTMLFTTSWITAASAFE